MHLSPALDEIADQVRHIPVERVRALVLDVVVEADAYVFRVACDIDHL